MEYLGNIPDTLYKYRDWKDPFHKRILTECEVYLASPDQFNDPYDVSLPFRYKEEEMTPENIFIRLEEIGKENWPDITTQELHQRCFERQNSGAFEEGMYWKENHEEFVRELHNKFGIISLTSKKSNLLMWSHYADSHKGFCVGLDKFSLFEQTGGQIGPVNYSREIPRIGWFNRDFTALQHILVTKSEDWHYEDEFRIVKINECRKVIKLKNETIKEIVLGLMMEDSDKNEIVKLANEHFPKAKIYECFMSLDNFELKFIPILK